MRKHWQAYQFLKQCAVVTGDIQFIRPVKTLTVLLGDELVEGKTCGVASARTILRGYRFMGEQEFTIDSADQYSRGS